MTDERREMMETWTVPPKGESWVGAPAWTREQMLGGMLWHEPDGVWAPTGVGSVLLKPGDQLSYEEGSEFVGVGYWID